MKPSTTKPKFQFSMKTLMFATTLAAVLSAIAGWLGPFLSVVIILASCQLCVFGGLPTWLTVSILRRNKPKKICLRVTLSVLLTALLFIQASLFCMLMYGAFSGYMRGSYTGDWLGQFPEEALLVLMYNSITSFLTVAILFSPVLAIGAFFQMAAVPLTRTVPATSRGMAMGTGLFVGGGTLPIISLFLGAGTGEVCAFSFIPGAFGLAVSPCVLLLADWLGPKDRKPHKKHTLQGQTENNSVEEARRNLQDPTL